MLVLKRAAFAIAVLSLLDASEAFTERLPASLFGVPTRLSANLVASVLNIETRAMPAMLDRSTFIILSYLPMSGFNTSLLAKV